MFWMGTHPGTLPGPTQPARIQPEPPAALYQSFQSSSRLRGVSEHAAHPAPYSTARLFAHQTQSAPSQLPPRPAAPPRADPARGHKNLQAEGRSVGADLKLSCQVMVVFCAGKVFFPQRVGFNNSVREKYNCEVKTREYVIPI